MASVSRFLTTKLRLTVNEAKSAVARPEERKFLGFSISNDGSERRRSLVSHAATCPRPTENVAISRNPPLRAPRGCENARWRILWECKTASGQSEDGYRRLRGPASQPRSQSRTGRRSSWYASFPRPSVPRQRRYRLSANHPLRRSDRGIRFAHDSPLEGNGFEPSVPGR
jgi:hypothetical protein